MVSYFQNIDFANPGFFWLLAIIPIYLIWQKWKFRTHHVDIKMSNLGSLASMPSSLRARLLPLLNLLRILTIACIVFALARPQKLFSEERVTTEGIDIVIAMDISSSMMAVDFRPNRIEAAKKTAVEFIENRPYDRIGLVVFAGESFTQCPITLDHSLLKELTKEADNWQLDDGTAMGDGLWMGINRLVDSTNLASKVVILLTDGVRTAGEFSPMDAALAASDLNIVIYTIGIGSNTSNPIPVLDKRGRKIYELDPKSSFDENTLKKIAEQTDGKYFRATSEEKLREIYKEIDRMEKEKIEVNVSKRNEEKFFPFALLGILFLFLEVFLKNTIFRSLT